MKRSDNSHNSNVATGEWTSIPVASQTGVWEDGWVGGSATFRLEPPKNTTNVRLVGYKPEWLPNLLIFVDVEGVRFRRQMMATGHFVIDLPFRPGLTHVNVSTTSEPVFVPSQLWDSAENRALSWVFVGCEVQTA